MFSGVSFAHAEEAQTPQKIGRLFDLVEVQSAAVRVHVNMAEYEPLKLSKDQTFFSVPISENESLTLALTPFNVIAPDAKFVIGTTSGDQAISAPDILLWRGEIYGQTGTHVYLSVTSTGVANGYFTTETGETYFISQKANEDLATIAPASAFAELPPFAEFCGVGAPDASKLRGQLDQLGLNDSPNGARLATIAFDSDKNYYDIFGNETDALNYMVQLLGAVGDIYLRDFNVRLVLAFSRLWPAGGEPFSSYSVSDFRDYWLSSQDTTGLNIIHLLSGKRDLPFGGVAFVDGACNSWGYAISGYLNGAFPSPIDLPSNGNWDVIVTAHEWGHTLATYHTHDGYSPAIDDCGNGVPSKGTIMSYCHIWPGYASNIFMRFHSRVQEQVEGVMVLQDCLPFDCNGNGIPDDTDIANLTSPDVNSNGIPDECEDCNNNAILDDIDISNGGDDINGNGILDECEIDCNSNGFPDEWEIEFLGGLDENGNNIPDGCEPDCNGNSSPDFVDILNNVSDDFDRNSIPDECQDCNSNGIPDWLDNDRQFNLFVADNSSIIREYHEVSGYPIQALSLTGGDEPYDLIFGPDKMLYVACHGSNNIRKVDPATGIATVFVPSSGGTLAGPSSLIFGADYNLYVANRASASITRYNGLTGAFIDIFVPGGSGGLIAPYGLTFGPNGNLFVTSSNNTVIEYSSANGSLVGTFVTAGSGGLGAPRGLTFDNNNDLLVCSYNTSAVLKFDGATGAFLTVFNDENPPDNPWGIRIGPNGNVFVVRTMDYFYQIFEYIHDAGRYYRSFVRRDVLLTAPTGLAFAPASLNDCNGNRLPDECEVDVAECCCVGITGNLNSDILNKVNVSDISYLVAYLFGIPTGPKPECTTSASVNNDAEGKTNVSDLAYLVDYLFGIPTGPVPFPCP